jgi:hypothetical protein
MSQGRHLKHFLWGHFLVALLVGSTFAEASGKRKGHKHGPGKKAAVTRDPVPKAGADTRSQFAYFTLEGAGRTLPRGARGSWRPSDRVVVVTRKVPGPRNTFRRFIITAYPVRPISPAGPGPGRP